MPGLSSRFLAGRGGVGFGLAPVQDSEQPGLGVRHAGIEFPLLSPALFPKQAGPQRPPLKLPQMPPGATAKGELPDVPPRRGAGAGSRETSSEWGRAEGVSCWD